MPRTAQLRKVPSLSWTTPIPDFQLETSTGWLSPEGLLYACGYGEHETLADALGIPWAPFVGAIGWLHLEDDFWSEPTGEATQKQIDIIFSWCLRRNAVPPAWFSRGHS